MSSRDSMRVPSSLRPADDSRPGEVRSAFSLCAPDGSGFRDQLPLEILACSRRLAACDLLHVHPHDLVVHQ